MRQEVKDFAEAMEHKLAENDHKTHWAKQEFEHLFTGLAEEYDELVNSFEDGESVEQLLYEAADLANYAMMIADNYKRFKRGANETRS